MKYKCWKSLQIWGNLHRKLPKPSVIWAPEQGIELRSCVKIRKKEWHHLNTCMCSTLFKGTFVVFSIVRVPWLAGGTEAVFSGTINQGSFLLFGNALSVPDGSYVPKGPSRPFWRLSLVIKECCTISFPWKALFLSLKLLNHPCQLLEFIKLFWVTNQFPCRWTKWYPGGMVIYCAFSFWRKVLRQGDNIPFFSQAFCSPTSLQLSQLKNPWFWSLKKKGLSTWMALLFGRGGEFWNFHFVPPMCQFRECRLILTSFLPILELP